MTRLQLLIIMTLAASPAIALGYILGHSGSTVPASSGWLSPAQQEAMNRELSWASELKSGSWLDADSTVSFELSKTHGPRMPFVLYATPKLTGGVFQQSIYEELDVNDMESRDNSFRPLTFSREELARCIFRPGMSAKNARGLCLLNGVIRDSGPSKLPDSTWLLVGQDGQLVGVMK